MLKYILLLYIILVLINTNSIEKKMLYNLLLHGDFKNVSQHPVEYDIGIWKYITAPFYFDRNRLTKVSDGELFNAYCFTKPYADIQRELQSKIFWDTYLPRHGIKVPQLYATTKPFRVYEDIDPDKEYISKPEYGTTGDGVEIIRGVDVGPTRKNHLIQEKIISCGYHGARTFRVITTYDGEVLVVYEYKNDNEITSNLAKGATPRVRTNVPEIAETVDTLRTLHVRDFDFCFTIGWDLMVDCDDVYVLEGNWPSGLYGSINNNDDEFFEKVKSKANRFYALNNI